MQTTVRAKFNHGVIEPLEKISLEEGIEVNITISVPLKTKDAIEILKSTAGAWKGTIDAEKLKKDIYSDRLIQTRLEPKL